MKRWSLGFAVVMMAILLAGCGGKAEETTAAETTVEETTIAETEATTEEAVGLPNPWSDCNTLKEAEAVAGFTYNYGETVKNGEYSAVGYRAMEGMLEISYENGTDTLTIRQAPGEGQDISGDYTVYSHDFTVSECGVEEIRLRGTKDVIYETDFSWDGYSYNLCSEVADYDMMGTLVGEVTGQTYDPEAIYRELESEMEATEEPEEGAPVVAAERKIDETAILAGDIAGQYKGEIYPECSISIYSSRDDDSAEIGNIIVIDEDGDEVFSGNLIEVMDNFYELSGLDVNFTVYTEGDTICLDFYVDGEHTDYLTMTEHFES